MVSVTNVKTDNVAVRKGDESTNISTIIPPWCWHFAGKFYHCTPLTPSRNGPGKGNSSKSLLYLQKTLW